MSHMRFNAQGARALHNILTDSLTISTLIPMEVRFKPETESRLNELAPKSGRRTDELVEDAMAAYLTEVAEVRSVLEGRLTLGQPGRMRGPRRNLLKLARGLDQPFHARYLTYSSYYKPEELSRLLGGDLRRELAQHGVR